MRNILISFLISFVVLATGALAAPMNSNADLDNFFKSKTKIENPLELRDPFKAPVTKASKRAQKGGNYFISGKGEFTNIGEDSLNNLNIQDLKVVGVMIGRERRAMLQGAGTDKKVIVVKEGSKIGPDNAEIKAILPGGIVLVEKIMNVYGQEEYLETVIPISR